MLAVRSRIGVDEVADNLLSPRRFARSLVLDLL